MNMNMNPFFSDVQVSFALNENQDISLPLATFLVKDTKDCPYCLKLFVLLIMFKADQQPSHEKESFLYESLFGLWLVFPSTFSFFSYIPIKIYNTDLLVTLLTEYLTTL